jgi:hypothetical protein
VGLDLEVVGEGEDGIGAQGSDPLGSGVAAEPPSHVRTVESRQGLDLRRTGADEHAPRSGGGEEPDGVPGGTQCRDGAA